MSNSITDEIRDIAYTNSKPVQNFLYATSESGLKLHAIAAKYDLHKGAVYKKFALTVGDIILGFYRIEDTVPLLQQELGVNPRTAALLGADVLDFLAPLSDPAWVPPASLATPESEVSPATFQPRVSIPVAPVGTTTPTTPVTVPTPTPQPTITIPLQTSEPAFGFEPVHTSSQDTSRIPLSAVPSYAHPTPPQPPSPITLEQPPRWGA